MLEIYVDADACPVKDEVNRVAQRYQLHVTYVANCQMRVPDPEKSQLIVVDGNNKLDAADDWIAEHVSPNDIVITGDIPLAYRCIKKGAQVLGLTGRVFSEENIGHLLATRDLMSDLRQDGTLTGGGPPPFQKQDRSRFLHALDQIVQTLKRQD